MSWAKARKGATPVPVPIMIRLAALVQGHLEGAAEGPGEGDRVAGLGVAQKVGGDAREALAADFVDVEAAAYQDLQVYGLILGPGAGVGDGITTQVIGVAEGVGPGHDHADALTLDELEGRVRDPQAEMAHLLRLLWGDASGIGD